MSLPHPLFLPTPSPLHLPTYLSSPSHPSLPLTATTHRTLVRLALKSYLKAASPQKPAQLPHLLAVLETYIPHLLAIAAGLDDRPVAGDEEIDVLLTEEVESEWKSTLLASDVLAPLGKGRRGKGGRTKGRGLDFEIVFTLHTLALVYRLLAWGTLRPIHGPNASIDPEQRSKAISAAMKYLLQAESVHAFLSSSNHLGSPGAGKVPETNFSVQDALRDLSMAESTLLAVSKDDPYPAAVAQERSKVDREWMYKGIEIPKVRAHLFARLCIAAGERAGKAEAMFSASASSRVDEELVKCAKELKRTARARACRFFGIDDELGGETGRAIAWLRGAKGELGVSGGGREGEEKGWAKFSGKLKKGYEEKMEDRRVERGGESKVDAGRMEEGRVLEMLEKKWVKMNDTVRASLADFAWMNTQLIPPFEPLLAGMPSGREIHVSKPYVPPELDADVLEKMRAPPDPQDERALMAEGDDSSDDEGPVAGGVPGSFPSQSASSHTASDYY